MARLPWPLALLKQSEMLNLTPDKRCYWSLRETRENRAIWFSLNPQTIFFPDSEGDDEHEHNRRQDCVSQHRVKAPPSLRPAIAFAVRKSMQLKPHETG